MLNKLSKWLLNRLLNQAMNDKTTEDSRIIDCRLGLFCTCFNLVNCGQLGTNLTLIDPEK